MSRLKSIHDRGVIHRDVKPENFVFKLPTQDSVKHNRKEAEEFQKSQVLYIVDFGLSRYYVDKTTGKHNSIATTQYFIGTAGYSSLNTHRLLGN